MSPLSGVLVGCGALVLIAAAVGLYRLNAHAARQRETIRTLRQRVRRQGRKLERLAEAAQAGSPGSPAPPDPLRDVSSPAIEVLRRLVFDGGRPAVVLLLQSFGAESMFAGVKTAVIVAAKLAAASARDLRVIVVDEPGAPVEELRAHVTALVRYDAGCPELVDHLRLSVQGGRIDDGHTSKDVFLATFWTTALAVDQLARAGRVDRQQVVYLIQDFEPGFYPWGDLHAKARSTYDAGFTPLVNSSSLARFVQDNTRLQIPDDQVIAPALDVAALDRAARAWTPPVDRRVRVLFYARPSKGRNMFTSGLQALRRWADDLPEGAEATVTLAGELATSVDLGPRVRVEALGKVSYADYYELLSRTDVGLALMYSPHPGHLALEMPLAGIPTITNEFQDYRVPWVTDLTVAASSPESLARALTTVATEAWGRTRHVPGRYLEELGGTVDEAVAAAARRLQEARR